MIENLRMRHAQGRFTPAPEEMLDQYHAILIELIRLRLRPKPGLREALNFVREQEWRCGTASSGDRVYIDVVPRRAWDTLLFSAVATGEEVVEGKPHPALYLLAAERLGVPPAECVALEDSPRGVRAAKAAGMRCIAVPEGLRTWLRLTQFASRCSRR